MYVLGSIDKGYVPTASDHVFKDGRVIGPFESTYARDRFARFFGEAERRLFTAREVYENDVLGDEYHGVLCDEVSLEMHPLWEIQAIWIKRWDWRLTRLLRSGMFA